MFLAVAVDARTGGRADGETGARHRTEDGDRSEGRHAACAEASGQNQPAKPAASSDGCSRRQEPGRSSWSRPSKGVFEFETYPDDAPKTVANFLALTKKGFFNGQRFHRVVPGFVIQAGDPQTRDMSKRADWGRGAAAGSGKPIGVAEFSKKHLHTKGAVAMAHAGNAAEADSQFYVTLAPKPALDGKYAVFGQVISGADVPAKIAVGDVIKRMYVKGAPAK